MATQFIENQIEAEQLRKRIELLTEENRTLRELATPTAGPLQLQAENILLEREAKMLTELIPHLVPYEGPLPQTLEQFNQLPAPNRRQLARENYEHIETLRHVDQLLQQALEHDRQEARRLATLEGLPVRTQEEFMALDDNRRQELAMGMTKQQRLALCGETPNLADDAYL
ncbi:MAG: hypothetical protein HQ546_05985 [Planctomycetes bacterium]|nr:hypothetical protein [Planctomycetota bacterium]